MTLAHAAITESLRSAIKGRYVRGAFTKILRTVELMGKVEQTRSNESNELFELIKDLKSVWCFTNEICRILKIIPDFLEDASAREYHGLNYSIKYSKLSD